MASPLEAIAHITGLVGVYGAGLHFQSQYTESQYHTENRKPAHFRWIRSASDAHSLVPQQPAQTTITLHLDAVTSTSPSPPAVQPMPSAWQPVWEIRPPTIDMAGRPGIETTNILICIVVIGVMVFSVLMGLLFDLLSEKILSNDLLLEATDEIEDLRSTLSIAIGSLQDSRRREGQLQEEVDMTKAEQDGISEQLEEAKRLIHELQQKDIVGQSTLSSVTDNLKDSKLREGELKDEVDTTKTERDGLSKQLEIANKVIAERRQNDNIAQSTLSTVSGTLEASRRREGQLEDEVDAKKAECDGLSKQLKKANNVILTLEQNDILAQTKFYKEKTQFIEKEQEAQQELWSMEEQLEQEKELSSGFQQRVDMIEKELRQEKLKSQAMQQRVEMTEKALDQEKAKSKALQEGADMAKAELQKQSKEDCSKEVLPSTTDVDEQSGEKQEPLDTKDNSPNEEKRDSLKSSMWANQTSIKTDNITEALPGATEAKQNGEGIQNHSESLPSAPAAGICYYKCHTYDENGVIKKTYPCKSGPNCIGDPSKFKENGNARWSKEAPHPYGGEGRDFASRRNDENRRREHARTDEMGLCSWCYTVQVPNPRKRIWFTEKELQQLQQDIQARAQSGGHSRGGHGQRGGHGHRGRGGYRGNGAM